MEGVQQELHDVLVKVGQLLKFDAFTTDVNLDVSKTEGFLSELYTGVVANKHSGIRVEVAVKKTPKQAGLFVDNGQLYVNEDNFYSKIFPTLDAFQKGKNVTDQFDQLPKYFFGCVKPGEEYIVMENIVAAGYKLTDKSEYLPKDHLELVFRILGKFHALSFAYKDQHLDEYNALLKYITDIFINKSENDTLYKSISDNVRAGFNAFNILEDRETITKLKKIKNIEHSLKEVNKYKGEYKCIIHGDSWSNNLLFKYQESTSSPVDMKLVDFQMLRETTPVHDLAFLFYCEASDDQLDHLDQYLKIYHQSLSHFAVELGSDPSVIYPMEALKQDWLDYGLSGVFLGFDLLALKLVKPAKALEMRNKEEENKEEGMRMWDEEIKRVRKSAEFTRRSRVVLKKAIQHCVL